MPCGYDVTAVFGEAPLRVEKGPILPGVNGPKKASQEQRPTNYPRYKIN